MGYPIVSDDLKPSDALQDDGSVTRSGKTYGCHVSEDLVKMGDLGCVLSYGEPRDCKLGILSGGRERRSRWTCPHWKVVNG